MYACEMHTYEEHAYGMGYVRCTPRGIRLWDGFCERHAYERRAYEMAPYEVAAYERHDYEMAYERSMHMRSMPTIRPMGEACL
jgi:hypothetical protein